MMTVARLAPDEARRLELYRQARHWAGYMPTAPLRTVESDMQRAMVAWNMARARESERRRARGRGR